MANRPHVTIAKSILERVCNTHSSSSTMCVAYSLLCTLAIAYVLDQYMYILNNGVNKINFSGDTLLS